LLPPGMQDFEGSDGRLRIGCCAAAAVLRASVVLRAPLLHVAVTR
jgi:hypothetical protein